MRFELNRSMLANWFSAVRLDLRRDYLNELGVPQWYARKRLSGAAAVSGVCLAGVR